jgi:hypothetical protein
VDVDVDTNEGDGCCICQLFDDNFFLVVWVDKSPLPETLKAIAAPSIGQEVMFGTISNGGRVWVSREESDYWIVIGDPDSKDAGFRLSPSELEVLLVAVGSCQ